MFLLDTIFSIDLLASFQVLYIVKGRKIDLEKEEGIGGGGAGLGEGGGS